MKASRDATIFMDLSFLSSEEEAIIQKVLLRDEDLKKHEIGRVRKLRESVPDHKQMKVFSGEWFEDLKSKRYGRQPHASAVVRSSMRWKKSAGPKPNPFLKVMGEDQEKNVTRLHVSTDPRLIHPALSFQAQQEITDEAAVLEAFPAVVNPPVYTVIEVGPQSGAKLHDQTPIVEPSELITMQEWNIEPAITTELKTSDPEKTALKEDSRVKTSLEINPKQTDGNNPGNFKIRSFSKAQETSDWEILGSVDKSKIPQSRAEVVIKKLNRIETEVTDERKNPRPDALMSSGIGFGEEIQSPIPKRRGGTENRVINITTKQGTPARMEELHIDLNGKDTPSNVNPKMTPVDHVNTLNRGYVVDPVQKGNEGDVKQGSPTKMEELSVDLNVKKNPDFLVDPPNNVTTAKYFNWNPRSLNPGQKGKEPAVEKLIVTEFKPGSPKMVEEIRVNIDVEKDSEFLKNPVYNVNIPICANVDPVQNRKEQTVEKILVDGFKRSSQTKMEEEAADLDVEKNPDILEGSVNSVNAPKCTKLDQSLVPVQKVEKRAVDEIIVTDFKQRSPTKMEAISDDLDVEMDLDSFEDPGSNKNTGNPVNWDLKSLDPLQKEKQSASKEIIVADYKRRSPKKMEETSVDLNVKANPDFVQDSHTGSVLENLREDENRLGNMDRDELQEPAATGKTVFDVKYETSANMDRRVPNEIGATGEPEQEGRFLDREDECGISKNDILASVYARANRPKSDETKATLAQEPEQKIADGIPTIVIVPAEYQKRKELERVKNETAGPEALVQVANLSRDTWEDEGLDSEEHSSSDSSHDSDLSGKRDRFSASTLSVTERTASLLSVYSDAGDFGNVAVQGSVEFAVMYSPLGELVIMVEQCQDLAIANPRKQRTDPYVKTYLHPDKRSKRKTSIKKRTVNPVYVESLRYKVKREQLHGKTLNLSVWHNDSRGRNAFLGQVEINLKDWDWKHEALTWYNLQPKNVDNQELQEYRGLLCVSLKYMLLEATGDSRHSQATGEIHVWLREAKHLPRLKAQGVDSFAKCYMLPDTSKKSRQKTRVVKKTQNPVYNHNMVYDGFRAGEVREACCELTVWDNNKLSNQFLGGVRLSLGTGQSYGKKVEWMDSENGEVEIWEKMMAHPNSWVEAELPLRSSMTPKKQD